MGEKSKPSVVYDILHRLDRAGHNMLWVDTLPEEGRHEALLYLVNQGLVEFGYQPAASTITLTDKGREALQRLEDFAMYVLSGEFEDDARAALGQPGKEGG